MRKSPILVVTSLLAAACAPQSAELISGEFVAFVAESNSVTLRKEQLDLEGFDSYHQIDCRLFVDEESGEAQRLEDRKLNCGWGDDDRDDESHFFRDTDNNREEYDGDPVLDIDDLDDDDDLIPDYYDCDDSDADQGAAGMEVVTAPSYDLGDIDWELYDAPSNCAGGSDGYWPPVQENWLARDGFHVVRGDLDPWRGEGIVTHEGDLLVGFHHTMPGGADIRFQFAIDRFFQPTECIVQDDDSVVAAALDGDWVDEWSTELDYIASLEGDDFEPYEHLEPYLDGRLFVLNAGSYQYNPDENADWWYTPEQWAAGAAQATFGEEQMTHRPQLFAEPELYNLFANLGLSDQDLGSTGLGPAFTSEYVWWCEATAGTEWEANRCLEVLERRINRTADHAMVEFQNATVEDDEDDPYTYRPLVHMNKWRALDGTAAGYDGWGEMDYNYVVLSEDSDLRIGGRVEGAFTLVFDGEDSTSRMAVKGQFVIEELKADKWAPQDLREEKRAESGVDYCAY